MTWCSCDTGNSTFMHIQAIIWKIRKSGMDIMKLCTIVQHFRKPGLNPGVYIILYLFSVYTKEFSN
jgi:hypothetical protein